MKKLKYLFIFLASLLVLSVVLVSAEFIGNKNTLEAAYKDAQQEEQIERASIQYGLEKIKEIVDMNYGSIEYEGVSEINEQYKYKDNLYEYYINPDTGNLVGMIAMRELPLKETNKKINKDEALEISRNFTGKCFKDFFDYDVEIKVNDYTHKSEDAGPNWFSTTFAQKNELGTYTGYYIDIYINKYGEIIFYCAIEGNYEVAKQKPEITKEEVIDIAYIEAEEIVKEIIKIEKEVSEITVDQKAKSMGWDDEPIPPGDSGAYLDTESMEFEEFKANLDEKEKHEVSAKLSVDHDKLEWVIEIYNVEINRDWGPMGFSVIIDAITGEVLFEEHTE